MLEICSFEQLPHPVLYEMLALRSAVFVVEQTCIYQDMDGLDPACWHMLAWEKKEDGTRQLAGCLRLLPAGLLFENPSIGRFAVYPDFRRQHLGTRMLAAAIAFLQQQYPGQPIDIAGQAYLKDFYEGMGFETILGPYLEDDIPHYHLRLPASTQNQKNRSESEI